MKLSGGDIPKSAWISRLFSKAVLDCRVYCSTGNDTSLLTTVIPASCG